MAWNLLEPACVEGAMHMTWVVLLTLSGLDGGVDVSVAKTAAAVQQRLSRTKNVSLEEVTAALQRSVNENLAQKRDAGFSLEPSQVRRQVIEYEAFKLETFVSTGVFPKRYFGYLDEKWDTAAYETRLKRAAHAAAKASNRWLEAEGAAFRVTEQEIIVTFLAEGGAILLRERQSQLESIHPVQGIGLDDIAKGFVDLEPLIRLIDVEVGTHLASVVVTVGGERRLSRLFTFEEAIAGTATMWVWEKRIAESKLCAEGRASLSKRPLDEQFVITSLVYNSGILFNQKTIDSMRSLDTGPYLFDLSERSKKAHWALPVLTPMKSLERMLGLQAYPDQPTSWSAVYHVLQRYGGYVALTRFTDDFDSTGALTLSR